MIRVLGSLDSGIIIEADRASHLGGGHQSMVLTPAQAREMIEQLVAMGGPQSLVDALEVARDANSTT